MGFSRSGPRRLLGGMLLPVLLFGCTHDRLTPPDDPAGAGLPVAGSTTELPAGTPERPEYVRGDPAGTPPHVTGVVRVYQDEQPWNGYNRAHVALVEIGKVLGEDYFIHPLIELQSGIPPGTRLVVLTSNSASEPGQRDRQNHPAAQAALAEFLREGGHLIVDMATHLVDGGFIAPGAAGSPERIYPDAGQCRFAYFTPDAADHPIRTAWEVITNEQIRMGVYCWIAIGNLERGIALPAGHTPLAVAIFGGLPRLVLAEYCYEGKGRVIVDTFLKESGSFVPWTPFPAQSGTPFMRNLFAYGLSEAAECEPGPVPIDIHKAYSAPPQREPGTIHLDDPHFLVEILDILSIGGSGAHETAGVADVRIGDSFDAGMSAVAYEVRDLNMDGRLDIRLRWELQELITQGYIGPETTAIEVWGRNQTTGEMFRGETDLEIVGPDLVVLWDNGGFVTHPGAGAGGADVSMASPGAHNVLGSQVRLAPPGPHFRLADDFQVPAGGWTVNRVVTYGFEYDYPTPGWSRANLNIRSGSVTGPIVASATTASWLPSGVYRVLNGMENLGNTDHPVYAIRFHFSDLELAPGTYWIDWQLEGGVGGWGTYVMAPDPVTPGGANTQTGWGNGRWMRAGRWYETHMPPGAEIPFQVFGGGTPAAAPSGSSR